MGEEVALLAEGVDRNTPKSAIKRYKSRSPSSRRAWIEMKNTAMLSECAAVALLAEGVDRNMVSQMHGAARGEVALLAEGVDRNS